MKTVKGDVKKAVGCFQLCAGQEAGGEAVINAMEYSNPTKQRQYY